MSERELAEVRGRGRDPSTHFWESERDATRRETVFRLYRVDRDVQWTYLGYLVRGDIATQIYKLTLTDNIQDDEAADLVPKILGGVLERIGVPPASLVEGRPPDVVDAAMCNILGALA